MDGPSGVILKLFLASAVLSIMVKYGARSLSIEPNPTNALIGILLLPIAMMLILGWRTLQS